MPYERPMQADPQTRSEARVDLVESLALTASDPNIAPKLRPHATKKLE